MTRATVELVFVLGVDPGLSRCGYGCVEPTVRGGRAVAAGVLSTPPELPTAERLAMLQRDIRALIAELAPAEVAVERVFFSANARTAIPVAQASGVVLAEAAAAGCRVAEYGPNQVKEAVGGWGKASKDEVHDMVQVLLGLELRPRPADSADALAVALCHVATASAVIR